LIDALIEDVNVYFTDNQGVSSPALEKYSPISKIMCFYVHTKNVYHSMPRNNLVKLPSQITLTHCDSLAIIFLKNQRKTKQLKQLSISRISVVILWT